MTLYLIPLVVLWALGVVWIITMQLRKLPTPAEILPCIHRGAMNGLPELLSPSPVKAFMRADKLFWQASGGYSGLYKRFHNAKCYVRLCQHLRKSDNMPKEHLWTIWMIFLKILGCSLLALLEGTARIAIRFIPHFSARAAAQFYCELEMASQNLNLEFGKLNWKSHA